MRKTRVSDGVRTRDNWSHNPRVRKGDQAHTVDTGPVSLRVNPGETEATRTGSGNLAPGDGVVIVAGDAKGRTGRLVGLSRVTFGGLPVWEVDTVSIGGLRILRSIRQDYLAPVEVTS